MSATQLHLLEPAPHPLVLPAAPAAPRIARRRRKARRADVPVPPPGATNEWHTLDKDFLPLHHEFSFTIDTFASDDLHKLPRYWTAQDNALARPWVGERVFANPPYGRGLLARCVAKMAREADRAALICALVPAWTERAWWQDHVEPGRRSGLLEVRFPRGRLRFGWPGRPEGHPRCVAGFPSAIIIWRRP